MKLFLLPLALIFVSCASTKPIATFQSPSLAPLEQAVSRSEQNVLGARGAAKKLADATSAAQKQDKAWQDAYNELNTQLDSAYLSLQAAKDEIKVKQGEVDTLTNSANQVVVERNKFQAQVATEHARGNGWMKWFFYAVGGLVLCGLWIFKKPLMAMFV